MSVVALCDAALGYGDVPLLRGVNVAIESGEIVAVVGPNGAGKTTLLKTLLGLLPLQSGRLSYDEDIRRSPLGYVPQRDALDPIYPLSAHDVVLMGMYSQLPLWRGPNRSDFAFANDCLEEVGLLECAARLFSELSGGQKQRVLIARALATRSKVIFLDEPTAGTDPGAEASIVRLLLALNKLKRYTIVLVSHHLGIVRSLIPTVCVVHNGVAAKGPSSELLDERSVFSMFGEVGHA